MKLRKDLRNKLIVRVRLMSQTRKLLQEALFRDVRGKAVGLSAPNDQSSKDFGTTVHGIVRSYMKKVRSRLHCVAVFLKQTSSS